VARFDGPALPEPDTRSHVGHQVYALASDESTTEPVPVYTGSPAPKPMERPDPRSWLIIAGALALLAAALYLVLTQ
jgi:hypothetical protein